MRVSPGIIKRFSWIIALVFLFAPFRRWWGFPFTWTPDKLPMIYEHDIVIS
jgi:hypothetical protein